MDQLAAAGIEVLASRKDKDGLDHIASRASTGAINVYTISQAALAIAEQVGFDPLVTRELAEAIKPQNKPVDGPQDGTLAAPDHSLGDRYSGRTARRSVTGAP